jgi:hypothetical protein
VPQKQLIIQYVADEHLFASIIWTPLPCGGLVPCETWLHVFCAVIFHAFWVEDSGKGDAQ